MEIYSLSEWDLKKLINSMSEESYIFLPVFCQHQEGHRSRWEFVRWNPQNTRFQLTCRRTDALNHDFFFPPTNILHTFPEGQPGEEGKSITLLGYKACDINSLETLDRAFEQGEISYPFYEKRREETTIISCDCLEIADPCFCSEVGGNPYPESGFDLNVSTLPGYGDMLIEVGEDSRKGHEIADRYDYLLTEATEEEVKLREAHREKMRETVDNKNPQFEVDPEVGDVPRDAPFWEKYSTKNRYSTAFTLACPTSRTFHNIQKNGGEISVKDQVWDSVTLKDIHDELQSDDSTDSRLKEMFYDKFQRSQEVFGNYGCSGCGRCTSLAAGEIGMRGIITDATDYLKGQGRHKDQQSK